MKIERTFPSVTVTKKQEHSIKGGHPWVYEDEIMDQSDGIVNGSYTDVFGLKGSYLGTGFYSEKSRIRVRILDHNANETFQDSFFDRRVQYALQYRFDVMPNDIDACRLVHGEADGLPGLTVDRYHNLLVTQVESYGTDLHKDAIYHALLEQLKERGQQIDGIYERNEGELRKKEGLSQYKGWYGEDHPDTCITEITENGIVYEVDVENGQKTGFFLDQKYNRLAVRKLAAGKKVLDCCTHTGSFALNAAMGNASSVTAMDISQSALDMAAANAKRNNLSLELKCGDVFEVLRDLKNEHASYDFIILDPPAFTKARKTYSHARNGYQTINADAMRLLPRGGYLATASCSHFMPANEFRRMLIDAAEDAGVEIRIIEQRGAACDHPVMPTIPETEYLKFFLLQII
jgi:23S rRNA (cytosine1962-C5)-methyltransferase